MKVRDKVMRSINTKSLLKNAFPLLLFAVVIYLGLNYVGEEKIKKIMQETGVLAPVIFVVLKISTVVVAPLGSLPFYIIAPSVFGFYWSLIYITIADFVGYSVIFYIGHQFGRDLVQRLLYKTEANTLDVLLDRINSWQGFAYSRVIFFSFPELPSYVASLSKLSFIQYSIVSWPLIVITNVIFLSLGGALSNKLVIIVVFIGVAVITLVSILTRGKQR